VVVCFIRPVYPSRSPRNPPLLGDTPAVERAQTDRRGSLLLGVDGGNSKTIALVARADGTIVGAGRGGRSDIYETEDAFQAIADASHAALAQAGAQAENVRRAVYSVAGADWPADYELYRRELSRLIGAPGTVLNDSLGAIRAGTPDGIGVSVVCGTGVAIGARSAPDRHWHVSFWASPNHRYDPVRATLEAVGRAELGLSPPSLLQQLAPAATGCDSVLELVRRASGHGELRPPLTRLPGALLDAVAAGDAVAIDVLDRVATAMSEFAIVAAREAGLPRPSPLVLAGGVFRHSCPALADAIAAGVPGAEIVRATREPAVGALLLAFDEAGLQPDLQRLEASYPAAELFATH
jgi:N-acetylglucosamine kinase-like BadF-type ATPase